MTDRPASISSWIPAPGIATFATADRPPSDPARWPSPASASQPPAAGRTGASPEQPPSELVVGRCSKAARKRLENVPQKHLLVCCDAANDRRRFESTAPEDSATPVPKDCRWPNRASLDRSCGPADPVAPRSRPTKSPGLRPGCPPLAYRSAVRSPTTRSAAKPVAHRGGGQEAEIEIPRRTYRRSIALRVHRSRSSANQTGIQTASISQRRGRSFPHWSSALDRPIPPHTRDSSPESRVLHPAPPPDR